MSLLQAIVTCLTGQEEHDNDNTRLLAPPNEMAESYTDYPNDTKTAEETAKDILSLLMQNEIANPNITLNARVQTLITRSQPRHLHPESSGWWARKVAEAVFNSLIKVVDEAEKQGSKLYGAVAEALEPARAMAYEFVKEHPVITGAVVVLIVLALLVLLAPSLLELLGFVARGPVRNSLAARWQSLIGNVEYGSLFARLQSLAARYGKVLK